MRGFCLRHLFLIFSLCLITTSSYVLFELLDVDGSHFREHAPICSFEAVLPACGGEFKPASSHSLAPWQTFSDGLSISARRLTTVTLRPIPFPASRCLIVHTRMASERGSPSLALGSDPARRSA